MIGIRTQLRRKRYQDDLRAELEESFDLSTKDGLTGVFNRRYFDIHVRQMVDKSKETKKPVCIMMFDVDHFKQVNDTYGHLAGDAVLKTLASVLKSSFRVTDLIARYGGEEFIVLLNNIDLQNSLQVAEKTRSLIETTEFAIPAQVGSIHKTISIGVAEYHQGDTVEEFISKADKALYEAKETGRNKVVASK